MNANEGGLSPREHDELRDLVLAGTQRVGRAASGRAKLVAAGIALVLVGGIAGAVLANVVRDAPIASVPDSQGNGWVAFASGQQDADVLLVRDGSAPVVAIGVDGVDDVCPAFSHDGSRLVAGRTGADGVDAALVVADVTAEGAASHSRTIPLDGVREAPCAQWSHDGGWVAFSVDRRDDTFPVRFGELRIVDTRSGEARTVPDLAATDFAWNPVAAEVFIVDRGRVLVYSVATGRTRVLDGVTGAGSLDVSPDGASLAVERRRENTLDAADLLVMNADGTQPRVLVADYLAIHGVGPVWSPDGRRIVFQRICETLTDDGGAEQICREQHLAVVVTVADGGQTVLAAPVAAAPGTDAPPVPWYPWSVTWSPDGTRLLYVAWGGAVDPLDRVGILSVPVDGTGAPVVLHAGGDVRVYPAFPWNTTQSWGAARD